MVDILDYKIYGNDMQIVEIELDPGEGVRAEAGAIETTLFKMNRRTGYGKDTIYNSGSMAYS